jgi:hypothetical protein
VLTGVELRQTSGVVLTGGLTGVELRQTSDNETRRKAE